MSLNPGSRLGHYTITARLGAGGMGEVYRGRDTRLSRDVAIKIVPEALADDTERLARFVREAQTLAALNHPHIAHVYGFEDDGHTRAIVMELVEGEDLAQRIVRGRIPVREALAIAIQIAEAVEAAHDRGIVHRDLKPSNVMVDLDGRVRVLDFGLATAPAAPATPDSSDAATLTLPANLTARGVVVGTPAYMSPEQVTGQAADKRCDVWAFGCVLFEMLTGQRTFDAADTHDLMMAVASKEPEWTALGADVPESVRKLLRRCLEKNRRRRLSDMSAVRLELEEGSQSHQAPITPSTITPVRARSAWGPGVAIALMGVAAAGGWYASGSTRPADPARAMIRVAADLGAPIALNISQGASAVLSPNGDRLVFVGQPRTGTGGQRLYSRSLDALVATPIPGTDGAMNPFFSPDGQWLGFFANSKLRKIAIAGGTAVDLADARNGRGGSWGDDGQIVFMPDFYVGLWRVPATGGTPVQVTAPAGDATHRWPYVLPGSKGVIYTSNSSLFAYENSDIVLQPLPTGAPRVLQKNAFFGQYLPSGHLTFIQKGALHAATFDIESMTITGEALPLLDDVSTGSLFTGAAQFSVSNDGTAAYVAGRDFTSGFTTVDRSGNRDMLLKDTHNWGNPQFSPDGRRLAFDLFDGAQADVWVYDTVDQSLLRLTHSPLVEVKPAWSADGKRIAFITQDDYRFRMDWQLADGSGGPHTLIRSENPTVPSSFHPSGRYLAYLELTGKTSFDAKAVELSVDASGEWTLGRTIDVSSTTASEFEPVFSPDGRWIAYGSAHTGRSEIYVRPFPGLNGTWQVTTDGGAFPTWSRTANELLFATLDQRIMSVSYSAEGDSFRATAPRVWTNERHQLSGPTFMRNYVMFPDGLRVAFSKVSEAEANSSDPVVLVFNLFDELRRRVPSR